MQPSPQLLGAAGNGLAAEELGHRGADVDLDRLVVRAEGVGKVGEGLAKVLDRLAAEHEGQHALLLVAVGPGAEGREDGAVVDGRAHGELVLAGVEENVVDVDRADLLAQEVVVEGSVSLESQLVDAEVNMSKVTHTMSRVKTDLLGIMAVPLKLLPRASGWRVTVVSVTVVPSNPWRPKRRQQQGRGRGYSDSSKAMDAPEVVMVFLKVTG